VADTAVEASPEAAEPSSGAREGRAARGGTGRRTREAQSEQEAEAEALREALAIVLGGEAEANAADDTASRATDEAEPPVEEAESQDSGDGNENPELEPQTEPDNKRRKGLLGRLRGS
jgi:hypothetical protein